MDTKENSANKHNWWSDKGQRTMLIGIVVCIVVCAILFTFLGIYMVGNSNSAIDRIGEKTYHPSVLREAWRMTACHLAVYYHVIAVFVLTYGAVGRVCGQIEGPA